MSDSKKSLFSSPADLMRAIGSKEGFDPMPPSQHAYFMDRKEPPTNRVMGLLFASTIHPGKGRKRSTFARDRYGRAMKQKDFCAVLGIRKENMTAVFKKLTEQGRLSVDTDGRVYLGGNAQAPDLSEGEENTEAENEVICTNDFPRYITQFLQQLSEMECRQATAALAERVRVHKQWEADAMAQVRLKQYEDVANLLQPYGFQDGANSGRPRVSRNQFTVQVTLFESSVQMTENGRNGSFAHKTEMASVQNAGDSVREAASLSGFQSSQSIQSEVERTSVENPAAEQEKEAAAPRPPTPPATPPKAAHEVDASPVVAAVESACGRPLARTDPLRGQIADLGKRFRIPDSSVCRWIDDKIKRKGKFGYKIHTPGAWYEFACEDLPDWIKQHPREIESDRKQEESQRRARAAPDHEPFDPAAFNAELKSLAAKKGMS